MRGVTILTTSVALAVPAILWPPRPVRAETLAPPVAAVELDQTGQSAR